MTPVRRAVTPLLALALGAAAAFLLACGDRGHLIAASDAASLKADLTQVASLIAQGQCADALQAATAVQAKVRALPDSVDQRLRERLRSGAQALVQQAQPGCLAAQNSVTTDTTTQSVPTVQSTPAETTTTDTTTTDTTPTQTDTTPTETTTPPDTTTTDTTGGVSPPATTVP